MNVLQFADLLETTDKVQCYDSLFEGDKCCAWGLAALALDPNANECNVFTMSSELTRLNDDVDELCGMTIPYMNDRELMSFKSMAKLLRDKHDYAGVR